MLTTTLHYVSADVSSVHSPWSSSACLSQVRREWIYRRRQEYRRIASRPKRARRELQTDTIDEVRQHIRHLLDGDLAPYDAGAMICASALGRETGQWPWLWLLWATLTAPCGGHRETLRAEDTMRLVAAEWLEVSGDETRCRKYFDHWLHDVLGWPKALQGLRTNASNSSRAGQSTGGSSASTITSRNIYPCRVDSVEETDAVSRRSATRRYCK